MQSHSGETAAPLADERTESSRELYYVVAALLLLLGSLMIKTGWLRETTPRLASAPSITRSTDTV